MSINTVSSYFRNKRPTLKIGRGWKVDTSTESTSVSGLILATETES